MRNTEVSEYRNEGAIANLPPGVQAGTLLQLVINPKWSSSGVQRTRDIARWGRKSRRDVSYTACILRSTVLYIYTYMCIDIERYIQRETQRVSWSSAMPWEDRAVQWPTTLHCLHLSQPRYPQFVIPMAFRVVEQTAYTTFYGTYVSHPFQNILPTRR